MRFSILISLFTIVSAAFCKDHHPFQRDTLLPRRYKDNKNKRGIGDYSGLTYGGSSFQGFQAPSSAGVPFIQGFPSFGGYGGYGSYGGINSLGHSPFNLSPQPSPAFSSIGAHSLGSHNLGQPLSIAQNSGYNLQSPGLNFASLLSSPVNSQTSYLSTNTGLYSPMEKTGPVTFTPQASMAAQSQSQYTPIYATGPQAGSNNYGIPVILGASQGSNLQGYRIVPSTLNNLNSQGLSISSSPSNNGGSYSTSYLPLSGDSSSHVVSSGYIMAASTPEQSTSSSSYSMPISALSSAPSSSAYTMTLPASSYSSISSNPSNSSPSSSYQLPVSTATYTNAPSSISGDYKYAAALSNDNAYSTSNQMRNYGAVLKLENLASPNTVYGSSSNSNSGYLNSADTNYFVPQTYSSNNLRAIPSRQPSYLVTSYGTPAMSYSIPSTSYGTPSNTQSIRNTNYNSQSSVSTSPSVNYASSDISNYSNSGNTYSTPSSASYDTDSSVKNTGRTSSINYSRPSTIYSSFSSSSSNDGNSILNYKSTPSRSTSNLSNSIENYSSSPPSNIYDTGSDSTSSYSHLANRYLRYPVNKSLPYIDSGESAGSSGYDTISYSVPNGKY